MFIENWKSLIFDRVYFLSAVLSMMLLPGCDGSITLPLCCSSGTQSLQTRELDANINTKHSIISGVVRWSASTAHHTAACNMTT